MHKLFALSLVIILLFPLSIYAKSNMLFILDGSNSMWGQVDGEAKIISAQNVLGGLLKDLPINTQVGFMTYGHREEGSCEDIEVLAGVGEVNSDVLINKINTLKPKGKTPIAAALAKSIEVLKQFEGDNNNVVLISDGLETCGGDPCAAAKALADAGIQARVHVVGFDVSEQESSQLQCIPAMGNGQYFSATNAEELKTAITEVKEAAIATPSPPESVVWFEDNFDGDDLSEHWEVINPDPDGYIVENGSLLILTSGDSPLAGSDGLTNIFRLTQEMPEGDWKATMRLIPEVATFRERYILALYRDKDNMLSATSGNNVTGSDNHIEMRIWGDKVQRAKTTGFSEVALNSPGIGYFHSATINYINWTKANEKAVLMQIKKVGRNYWTSIKVEGDATMADGMEPEWVDVSQLTSLRSPGDSLVIALTQVPFAGKVDYQVEGGEALVMIDWVKIEAPGQAK